MLFLLFQLNESRYALEAGCVLEILPLVEIKKLPHAAPGVAGLFYYRGAPVPVIDLSALALGRPARERRAIARDRDWLIDVVFEKIADFAARSYRLHTRIGSRHRVAQGRR
jgi:chemotaxis signal transduction protein